MSSQLARRTGTVSALVAAASVTMVAGCWPALAAGAPDHRPGRVASAPGQQDKAAAPVEDTAVSEPVVVEPVPEPVVEPVVQEPVVSEPAAEPVASEPVAAEPVVEEAAPRPGRSGSAPGQVAKQPALVSDGTVTEPVAQEPQAVPQDSAAGQTQTDPAAPGQEQKTTPPGQDNKDVAAPAPVVGPPTGVAAPVVGPPTGVTAPTKEQAPKQQAPKQQAPKAQAPKADEPKAERPAPPRSDAAPVAGPPVAPVVQAEPPARPVVGPPTAAAGEPQNPAAQPRRAPAVVGPQLPVAAPDSAVLAGGLTLAAPAGRRALASAADPWPLRPAGSSGMTRRTAVSVQGPALAQPESQPVAAAPRRPEALQVDIGTALPALATGTVEAVASRPQIPAGIVAVVVVFLLLQSRIDRRDPKLAMVRLEDDAPLEFEPTEAVLAPRQLAAAS